MTKKTNPHDPIILPALRGIMGKWVYYICLMSIHELGKRVHYAKEVHNSKQLSDMIQRILKNNRAAQVAQYLENQPDRFFNALVVATYEGRANWHALTNVNQEKTEELQNLNEETVSSVGFLTFRGDEKLFALDGQHRLAGIKKTLRDNIKQVQHDEVAVIFVGHEKTSAGLERTRRLFTTLNKTARPVSQSEIIALDEDDVMAICVRRLIEKTTLFSRNKAAFVETKNMPTANIESLTTIVNLYDILTILFSHVESDLKKNRADLQRARPDDEILDEYFKFAENYFIQLRKNYMELDEFFSAKDTKPVVKKYRNNNGGHILFRPIGLEIITKVIAALTKDMSVDQAIRLAAQLPVKLNEKAL